MTGPQRIQRKRTKGWRMPAGAVNVTRGTEWGNPFKIGDAVTLDTAIGPVTVQITRVLALELFRAWVTERGWCDQIRHELAGRDLACWCAPDQVCHADVLLSISNSPPTEGSR